MKTHIHRCMFGTSDHRGACICICGATVRATGDYQWEWLQPDGSTSVFPGPAWKPSVGDAQLVGGFVR